MNDHERDIPTIGRQGDAPPPEREYDNTPVWGKVTDVAWDLDEAAERSEWLECGTRLREIVARLRGNAHVSKQADKLWLCACDLDEDSVDLTHIPAIVDTLDEIAGELHEELFVKRGIVL